MLLLKDFMLHFIASPLMKCLLISGKDAPALYSYRLRDMASRAVREWLQW
jgi:hypothetical protein